MSIALAVLAGVLVGLSLGALGGGGAIITVPVLVYALGQSPHEATTGSLVIVGATAAIASLSHARNGRVRWGQGVVFGVLGTIGTVAGSRLSAGIDGNLLLLAFAALLIVVAALMWRRARRGAAVAAAGTEHHVDDIIGFTPTFFCDCPRVLRMLVTAAGVGLLTGFFGVGGGFAIVPALVMALEFPMAVAVGTSLLVIAINSATALVARLGAGISLDWPIIVLFTAAALAGSLLGSRVVGRIPAATLQQGFAVLLVVVSVYTGVRTGLALT